LKGLDEEKAAIIISEKGNALAEVINSRLGRSVTFLEGKGSFSNRTKTILYSVITRLEVAKLKGLINNIDDDAFVTVSDVFDIMGGIKRKLFIRLLTSQDVLVFMG
jgi:uncharacterized membrane-anchored protein YitT (DUF2179 family)